MMNPALRKKTFHVISLFFRDMVSLMIVTDLKLYSVLNSTEEKLKRILLGWMVGNKKICDLYNILYILQIYLIKNIFFYFNYLKKYIIFY